MKLDIPTILKDSYAGPALNPDKIVYSLYILNLDENGNKLNYNYSLDVYTRCPSLFTPIGPYQ